MVAGECQLLLVKMFLPRAVQPGHEVVQADLAHGDQARIVAVRGEGTVQRGQVFLGGGGVGQPGEDDGLREETAGEFAVPPAEADLGRQLVGGVGEEVV